MLQRFYTLQHPTPINCPITAEAFSDKKYNFNTLLSIYNLSITTILFGVNIIPFYCSAIVYSIKVAFGTIFDKSSSKDYLLINRYPLSIIHVDYNRHRLQLPYPH